MISILIPLYNGIEFLNSAINSVKSQTYENWEIIIGINGHARDSEVVQRVRRVVGDKIKAKFISKNNNKSHALNKLVQYAKYDYIAILDVDDRWLPDKLQKQVDLLNNHGYSVVGTQTQYFGRKHDSPNIPTGLLKADDFKRENPIINSSIVMRKDIAWWNTDYNGLEDYEMWCRLVANGASFYNIEDVLTNTRIHDKSFYNGKNHDQYKYRIQKTYFSK